MAENNPASSLDASAWLCHCNCPAKSCKGYWGRIEGLTIDDYAQRCGTDPALPGIIFVKWTDLGRCLRNRTDIPTESLIKNSIRPGNYSSLVSLSVHCTIGRARYTGGLTDKRTRQRFHIATKLEFGELTGLRLPATTVRGWASFFALYSR